MITTRSTPGHHDITIRHHERSIRSPPNHRGVTILKPSIEKLDAGLREIIESKGRSSKAKIIRGLFNRITEAMEEGITLNMLVDCLHQNDIAITKNSRTPQEFRSKPREWHRKLATLVTKNTKHGGAG